VLLTRSTARSSTLEHFVEGYRLYDLTASGGAITTRCRTASNEFAGLPRHRTTTAGYTAMTNRLLANNAGLETFVLRPARS
jgi:hypothetical protein